MPALDVQLSALGDQSVLADRWQGLEARSQGSFFLGWTWMGAWLATTGARPELLSVQSDRRDIALALIGHGMARRPLGRVPTLFLNQAGDRPADRAFIEYNGVLKSDDASEGTEAAIMRQLFRRNDWRVLRLAGMLSDAPFAAAGPFHRRIVTSRSPAYFVDLDAVRVAKGDYLSLLSANSRGQIRRSMREYGGDDLHVTRASTVVEANGWLAEMMTLNAGRHADNAWDEPLFQAFAHALVLRGMDNGEVELLRVAQGGHILGYLLNFVYRGRAMNYQSAFAPGLSSKAKPGLMCHVAAVARYADMECSLYSLLAGNDQYKQSLSTGHEILQWWNMERFSPMLEVEHLLRRIFRRPVCA
ncbi:GNAT family N-acetyltransferase [Rhizorhapis sp. SPR117]|uniref:GNAT family N-acetyltransferase n=1 Tax=Rhizorhapis sp. SPR117 TaxID=2912611 RepID=UPI001F2A04BA|nr:GNAT family N-acetyltransferase [Rhizorhapis sp. SPR117]